jgi:cation diffusion facilitator family transporter
MIGVLKGRIMTPAGILVLALGINLSLSVLKITWGHVIGSVGMLADGYHALLDSLSDLICLAGVIVSMRPPDDDHPYGHVKFEPLAQMAVGLLLFMTGYEVLSHSYVAYQTRHVPSATASSFAIMVLSMGLQVFLVTLETRVGRIAQNPLVKADAAHIRSDLIASFAVIVGLLASKAGFPVADPVVGILIALIIAKTGFELLKEGTMVLSDQSRLDPAAIVKLAMETPGVLGCHSVRSRGPESRIYMDMNLHVDDNLSVARAHAISHDVEKRIKQRYPSVVEVVVHIEPSQEEETHAIDPSNTHRS